MTDSTVIHQSLHGYSSGHKLLASSTAWPSNTRKLLQQYSDLSGPAVIDGFERYITGYPLPEIAAFAVACTWYAREMKRPGCVWTHSLVIDFDSLSMLSSPTQIQSLFRRPEGVLDFYEKPIHLKEMLQFDIHPALTGDAALPYELLRRIYEDANPVVVISPSSNDLEDLLLRIWTQQWPRLRRNFTFSSGSLSARFFDDKPFDLQVTPPASARVFLRDTGIYIVVDKARVSSSAIVPPWVKVAYDGMYQHSQHTLRDFLIEYGGDTNPNRSSFIPLVEVNIDLEGLTKRNDDAAVLDGFQRLVNHVASLFPDASEASHLKRDLFGFTDTPLYPTNNASELQLLLALSRTFRYTAFDVKAIMLRERAKAYAARDAMLAGTLLASILSANVTPIAAEILSGLLEGIPPERVVDVALPNPTLVPLFVSRYPALAFNRAVWQLSDTVSHSVVAALRIQPGTDWSSVAKAIIDAKAASVATDVFLETGSLGVHELLDRAESKESDLPIFIHTWGRVIEAHGSDVCSWLNARKSVKPLLLSFLMNTVDPHAALQCGSVLWEELLQYLSQLDADQRNRVAAYLFTYALIKADSRSADIASKTFQIVHDAQYHSVLTHEEHCCGLSPYCHSFPLKGGGITVNAFDRDMLIALFPIAGQ